MVNNRHTEKPRDADAAQQAVMPDKTQSLRIGAAADDMHRARTETANQQEQHMSRAVFGEITDILKGRETGRDQHGCQSKTL